MKKLLFAAALIFFASPAYAAITSLQWGVDRTTSPWTTCVYDANNICQGVFTVPATGGGALVPPAHGGTGVNNGANTFTVGGNTAFSGAFTFTGTLTGNTNVTFPTSGTLATTTGANVASVSNSDGTLVISPTTGAVVASCATATSSQLGCVKPGTGLSVTSGVVTPTFGTASSQVVQGGVIVAGGPTGSATVSPIVTYNAAGQLTAVSSATITPAIGSVTGLGTGVATALGTNVGSAGAPVLFNGAGGMPSSLLLTNATGLPISTGVSGLGTGVSSALAANVNASGGIPSPTPTAAGDLIYWNGSAWTKFAGNASGTQILSENASGVPAWTAAGSGTVTSVSAGTGMSFTTITNSGAVAIDKATAANMYAGASNKVLTADNVFTAEVAVAFNATQTLDFSTFLNGSVTLTGNITSLTCSNIKAGQAGAIRFIQDATGTRTMVSTWCTAFVWPGGVKGVLSTPASTVDALFYQCVSTTVCLVSLGKAFL